MRTFLQILQSEMNETFRMKKTKNRPNEIVEWFAQREWNENLLF